LHRARWQIAKLFGPTIDPFGAWLILRGVRTLGVRMARHNENGLSVAGFLEQHPAVRRVNYPGLATHPQHELAARQMRGFSGLLSFELASADEAQRFLAATRLSTLAVSFGDVATLVQHPASMTGAGLTDAERAAGGMTDGLIRLSVGLEDQKDLIQDLSAALEMAHVAAKVRR
jgi:methionine-gamma-lyase